MHFIHYSLSKWPKIFNLKLEPKVTFPLTLSLDDPMVLRRPSPRTRLDPDQDIRKARQTVGLHSIITASVCLLPSPLDPPGSQALTGSSQSSTSASQQGEKYLIHEPASAEEDYGLVITIQNRMFYHKPSL